MNEKRKERAERQLQRKLGIVFKTTILPDQWPMHLFNTFQQVRSFRKIDILTFPTSDLSITSHDSHQLLWRGETTKRAREIVRIAATIIEDAPVEMDTRLRLEPNVLRRFYLAIDWKETDTMFSTRADEMMSFDFSESRSEEKPKNRRPDRILGFQETNSLSRRFAQYDLMAGQLGDDPALKILWETVESTVLNHKGNALLFPFLVIEAKSRYGDSFDACNIQTAQPIVKMLKIQEDLQAKSQMTLEYGGPLLWYIAYRGEDWRLFACYISEKSDEHLYEVVNLWSGQLNDGDSALQLLLIIDYIYDWARDVFRPSIVSQLAMLANPTQDKGRVHDNGFTTADTDSDVFSLGKQRKDIETWDAALEDPTEVMLEEELSLIKWATYDSPLGVFRPGCIVESLFRCLCITKENVDELFSTIPERRSPKKLARKAENVLNVNHVLVSEDALGRMEEIWTNRTRRRQCQDVPEKSFFATINYNVFFAGNWELKRVISCLAFDEEALNLLRQYYGRKSIPVAIKRAKILRKDNAETLLTALKNQTVQQNLASALASQRQELRPVAGASSSSLCPTFKFADQSRSWLDDKGFQWSSDATASEVIYQVYDWCKKGSEEPTQPYIRFSQHMSSLTDSSTNSTVAAHFPDCEPKQDERWSYQPTLHLCLYVVPGPMEPPSKKLLEQALQTLLENDLVYVINSKPNSWKDTCQKLRTGKLTMDIWNAARLWKRDIKQQLTSRDLVTLPALETQPKLTCGNPLRQHTRSLSPSPSPGLASPSYIPPLVEAGHFLKRPFEATDGDEIWESEKRFKATDDCLNDGVLLYRN
ncbi:hypothetical protein F5882DRAFT_375096 [Hyaloscypha sp. PMI_1271]|nr:hypothetical protein F5882DRAFT_375096 [Hyaloscypha sp. PMI_1271]